MYLSKAPSSSAPRTISVKLSEFSVYIFSHLEWLFNWLFNLCSSPNYKLSMFVNEFQMVMIYRLKSKMLSKLQLGTIQTNSNTSDSLHTLHFILLFNFKMERYS